VAGEQLIDQAASRLRTPGCSNAAGARTRTVPASGSPAGPGGRSRPR
jgi:hypothetical protein